MTNIYAVYIIHTTNLDDEINTLNTYPNDNINKFIIGLTGYAENIYNSNITFVNTEIPQILQSFYAYKLFTNYKYCIEILNGVKLNINYNLLDSIECIGGNYIILDNLLLTDTEINKIKQIKKNINFNQTNYKIIDTIKIFNIISLIKNTFYENILYLYDKFNSINLTLTTIQLYIVYQLLYPNHFVYFETNEIQNLDKHNSCYGIRSHFKLLYNNKIIALENTKVKKDKINTKEQIYIKIGSKFNLHENQPYLYFYKFYLE